MVLPTTISRMSGSSGSSENVARHVRPVSSGHATATESSVSVTVTGPGRTSLMSNGTAAPEAVLATVIATASDRVAMIPLPLAHGRHSTSSCSWASFYVQQVRHRDAALGYSRPEEEVCSRPYP